MPINHGTPAGAVAHYRAGEKPCQACREARLSDQKRLRDERREVKRVRKLVQFRALLALAREFPEAYEMYLKQEQYMVDKGIKSV